MTHTVYKTVSGEMLMSLARNPGAHGSPSYERHQPAKTLLYRLVQQYYPTFKASLENQGKTLPHYIQREFEDFLQCGRLEQVFLRVRCEDCNHEHGNWKEYVDLLVRWANSSWWQGYIFRLREVPACEGQPGLVYLETADSHN